MEDLNDRAYEIASLVIKGGLTSDDAKRMCPDNRIWNLVKKSLVSYGLALNDMRSNAVDSTVPINVAEQKRICDHIQTRLDRGEKLMIWDHDLLHEKSFNIFGHKKIDQKLLEKYFFPICKNSIDLIVGLMKNSVRGLDKSPALVYDSLLSNRIFLEDFCIGLRYSRFEDIPESERKPIILKCFDDLNIKSEKLIVRLAMFYTRMYFHYHGNAFVFLSEMLKSNQYFDSDFVKWLLEIKVVTVEMLNSAHYPADVVDMLGHASNPVLRVLPRPIDSITNKSTEVYFWGLASSGKTCMIGSLLKVLSAFPDCVFDDRCQGYEYMLALVKMFKSNSQHSDNLFTLPPRTDSKNIYEMSVMVRDRETGKNHHITFVDMAGELIRAMALSSIKVPISAEHTEMIDTFRRIYFDRRNTNPRIHFFVWDYEFMDYEKDSYSQSELLSGALQFLRNEGIQGRPFIDSEKDFAGLVFSKADLFPDALNPDVVHDRAFYKEKIDAIINDLGLRISLLNPLGRLMGPKKDTVFGLPFTMGKVFFRRLCSFDPTAVRQILDFIISVSMEGGADFQSIGSTVLETHSGGYFSRLQKLFFRKF